MLAVCGQWTIRLFISAASKTAGGSPLRCKKGAPAVSGPHRQCGRLERKFGEVRPQNFTKCHLEKSNPKLFFVLSPAVCENAFAYLMKAEAGENGVEKELRVYNSPNACACILAIVDQHTLKPASIPL